MKALLTSILLGLSFHAFAGEEHIHGVVQGEESSGGKLVPLASASVHWLNTTLGTFADSNGRFELDRTPLTTLLVVSYIGYSTDTIETAGKTDVYIVLRSDQLLGTVHVEEVQKGTTIGSLNNIKTEILNEKELKKAACCNLSESFETNPTVEVSYSDALTGIRQIQMLGLSGIYAQTLVENIPMVHGLNAATGLTYIPGPFVENIYLSKGAGSAVYGFESMSGQINVELKKPEEMSPFFLNGYANVFGRSEINLATRKQVSKKWYTGLMAHGNYTKNAMDPNGDGFYNMPSGYGVNLVHRWKYISDTWEAIIGAKYVNDSRISGQLGYKRNMDRDSLSPYGVEYMTRQAGVWAKMGRPSTEEKKTSVGYVFHANRYENDFIAGLNTYRGSHNNLYASFLFNRNINNDRHMINGGFSLLADQYKERFNELDFERTEVVPGIFAEYTYTLAKKFSAVLGGRIDYNNLFGFFATPRAHLRYAINENHVIRASAGRGQRTANIFAENSGIFVSARTLNLPTDGNRNTYGLTPEISWNYGGNYTYNFQLSPKRSGQFSIDYYYVHFVNQAVVDMDQSAREIWIYNLKGRSFSQTVQAQVNFEPLKNFEVRLAYRYLDVRTTYSTGLRQKSLIPAHRGFINLAYATKKKWAFDLTTQFIGKKRLPDLIDNPEDKRLESWSPAYVNLNLQISKTFKQWEVYVGGENLLNVVQNRLIVDPGNPYGSYFDASMVWGPSMGAMAYVGFRYELKK